MYKIELKYGCNPNQKPSCIYMENGKDLPVEEIGRASCRERV